MKLLKTLPWLGTRRWTNSWTITNSPNASGRLRRSVLRVNRPFVDMDAHFFRMSRRCTSRTVTPMRSAHSHAVPFKSAESFQTFPGFIFVLSLTGRLSLRSYFLFRQSVLMLCRTSAATHCFFVHPTDNQGIGQRPY